MDGNTFVINVFRRFSDTHLPTHEDVTHYCALCSNIAFRYMAVLFLTFTLFFSSSSPTLDCSNSYGLSKRRSIRLSGREHSWHLMYWEALPVSLSLLHVLGSGEASLLKSLNGLSSFPFSSFLSSLFLLSQEKSMEKNLSCQGTVGKTIAFDLCYLSAICIHKRLLFIIIVFFYYHHVLSLAFFRHILSVLFCFFCHIIPRELGCVILVWPWGKLPKHKNSDAVSLKWLRILILKMDHVSSCMWKR